MVTDLDTLKRAVGCANERKVFGHPIGQNRGIRYPLAKFRMEFDAADRIAQKAAWLHYLELGTTNSSHVREILINGRDQVVSSTAPEWSSPAHAHVRGPGYYQ